jgi:hypothetical protein
MTGRFYKMTCHPECSHPEFAKDGEMRDLMDLPVKLAED